MLLCLSDVSLLNRRGELLEKARNKVADEGYVFKKAILGRKCMAIQRLEVHPRDKS